MGISCWKRSVGTGMPNALSSSRRPRSHSSSAQARRLSAGWESATDSLSWIGFCFMVLMSTWARLL